MTSEGGPLVCASYEHPPIVPNNSQAHAGSQASSCYKNSNSGQKPYDLDAEQAGGDGLQASSEETKRKDASIHSGTAGSADTAMMLETVGGTIYLAAAILFVIFLCTVQLLRYSGSSDAQSSISWREWMWPSYSGGSQQVDAGKSKSPHLTPGSAAGSHDSSSGEETVAPATVTVTVTATPPQATDTLSHEASTMKPLKALNTTITIPADMVHTPEGPKPNEIILVTATDGGGHNGGIEDILGKTAKNRQAYCDYHGYNYHFVNISKFDLGDAHPVWKKIPAIVEAFNTYPEAKWVFFLDLDAIIMSPKQGLTELVLSHEGMKKAITWGAQFVGSERTPLGTYMQADADLDNLDILFAQDQNGVNAGSLFLRRSKYTQSLLDMWIDPFFMKMDWYGREQETLLHFIKFHPTFRDHAGIIKQRIANAYVEGGPEMQWYKGDLVVHLAGCWVSHKCVSRWNQFWEMREVI
ncbi:hypothetical protein FKW77_009426 [Venturia effusa]|uniref:Nucleotide-diphospho-sugar transferase domain-containing protein n=1 Tax=Venturia effusa TaxID=50376 RepID=A0A517L441_9PEZI|nr:hypothetical protein FKW77_009426 [Venturia effusa]